MTTVIDSAGKMEAFGAALLPLLDHGLVFLCGDLGVGKTTLVRGLLRAAGYQGLVKSPTFTIVESYTIGAQTLHHFDLYRIDDPEELELMGIREYVGQRSLCFIEWPEVAIPLLPKPELTLSLSHLGEQRSIEINSPHVKIEQSLLNSL